MQLNTKLKNHILGWSLGAVSIFMGWLSLPTEHIDGAWQWRPGALPVFSILLGLALGFLSLMKKGKYIAIVAIAINVLALGLVAYWVAGFANSY